MSTRIHLQAERPVTIDSTRSGQRWFPFMLPMLDESLLLYTEHGYDAHFAPFFRLRSTDNGRTWHQEQSNVPRTTIAHCFSDGELYELDSYGVQDSHDDRVFRYYGAWSNIFRTATPARTGLVRIEAPSARPTPLAQMTGYPTFPWWTLFNTVMGKNELSGDEVTLGGPYLTSLLTEGNRMLATGYAAHRNEADGKDCVFLFESFDRGENWKEISPVARGIGMPEGANEATLTRLADGALYCIYRTGYLLHHVWSLDDGKRWSDPEPIHLLDSDYLPRTVWPVMKQLEDNVLVLVWGRPGKHMAFDPSGTGRAWQGHFDLHAWELETQALMGVPKEQRLHGPTELGVRHWDSGDYLSLVPIGPREMLVSYDVQNYIENWNSHPADGIRMVRVRLE